MYILFGVLSGLCEYCSFAMIKRGEDFPGTLMGISALLCAIVAGVSCVRV